MTELFSMGKSGALKSAIPTLKGDYWFNSPPLTPEELRGKVVLVDFWDYTCVNCLRTMPYMRAWYDRYHDKDLVIIGVHAPEFEFGKNPKNIEEAVQRLGLKYPIVMDNEYHIWKAFNNHYWPAKYLFDARGRLRYNHAGEGDYDRTESEIQKLLRELHSGEKFPPPLSGLTHEDKPGAVCYPMTPELYAGYWRGNIGNPEGYQPETIVHYHDSEHHHDGALYLEGQWKNEYQAMRHAEKTNRLSDYALIKYHAIEVNAVIKPEGESPFRVVVFQDGKPLSKEDKGADIQYDDQGRSYLNILEPRMYRVVYNQKYGIHELKLASDSPAFALYAYTFGACTVPK